MKINNNNNYNNMLKALRKTQQTNSAHKETNKTEALANKSVEISFSKEAQELAELSKTNAHAERVEDIKAAIANDSYKIEPEAIAKGILDTIKGQKGVE